jgi:hypothetical protein
VADVETILRADLIPSERLLWAGRARQGLRWRGVDWKLIWHVSASGVFLVILVVYTWSVGDVPSRTPFLARTQWFFTPVMLVIMLAHACLFFRGWWLAARWRKTTCYGVSNERILIIVARGRWRYVKFAYLYNLAKVTKVEHANGSGWLGFGEYTEWFRRLDVYSWIRFPEIEAVFDLAGEVAEVYRIISDAREALWEAVPR